MSALVIPDDAGLAQSEAYEREARDLIDNVQTPEDAQVLLAEVKVAGDALRLRDIGKQREQAWRGLALLAEHKYGELLGPAKEGPPVGSKNAQKNNVTGGHVISSEGERKAAHRAREVYKVRKEVLEEYIATDPKPTRMGLLRKAGRPDTHYVNTEPKPKDERKPRRPRNWNGKGNWTREHEIRELRKTGQFVYLSNLQTAMSRACTTIESYEPAELDFDADSLWVVDLLYDDLISLGAWVDRALAVTRRWLDTVSIRERIAMLRDTTGRTPEEAESFHRMADKLERQLELDLAAGE